jgi:predicted ATP-binding protein involved in virulence
MDLQSIANNLETYQAQTYGVQSQDSATDETTSTAEKISQTSSYDTYVSGDSEEDESIGIYQLVKNSDGDTTVQFNPPTQAGAAGGASASSSSSSDDSELEDLEDELEELQDEAAKLTKQLNAATDEEQAEKLQKQLDELENKITEKQSEIYQAETDSEE